MHGRLGFSSCLTGVVGKHLKVALSLTSATKPSILYPYGLLVDLTIFFILRIRVLLILTSFEKQCISVFFYSKKIEGIC